MVRKFLFPILYIFLIFYASGCYLIKHWDDYTKKISSSGSSSSIAVTNITVVTNSLTTTTNTFSIGDTNFMVINSTNILGTNIVLSSVYDTTNISAKCWVSNWIVLSNTITNLWCNITNASFKKSSLIYSTTNNFYFTNLIVLTNCPNAYIVAWVTTIAGSNVAGSVDGKGPAASFNQPQGIAVDSSGNIYVADTLNNKIRKITPAGVVTTLAGANTAGFADGNGTAAKFHSPSGIAVDSSGNIYVADSGNNRIRKITPAGAVTTLAGTNTAGFADGNGTAAKFDYPGGIAVDSSGIIYVADYNSQIIRKISNDTVNTVSTLAGTVGISGSVDANGTSASFNYPFGLSVDPSGNVYVADTCNNSIRKIDPAGKVTTLASGFDPYGVAVDSSNNLYVVDADYSIIYKISSAGVVTTLAGSGDADSNDGAGITASFNNPYGIALDSSGNVYVADMNNNKIRKIFTP